MEIKTAARGVKLVVGYADFADVMPLKSALAAKFKDFNLDVSALKGLDDLKNLDIALFLNPIIAMDSDKEIHAMILKGLEKSTYDREKITEQLFNDIPAAREDYYEILFAFLRVNIFPFYKGLSSWLSTMFVSLATVTQK